MVEYTIRVDNGVELICFHNGSDYYEFPKQEGETINDELFTKKKKEANYNSLTTGRNFMVQHKDKVYMNGGLVRTDMNVGIDDAQPVLNKLIQEFPDYTMDDLKSTTYNIVGEYGNYRPPYNNNSVSIYHFNTPSDALLEDYGCVDTYGDTLCQWYGLKHDLVTKDISAKIVFTPHNYKTFFNNAPTIDTIYPFFARIHNRDGTVSDWVDMYVFEKNEDMRAYCEGIGKPFPLPDTITEQAWIYSIVFNDTTGEINNVKGYIRQNA